MQSQRFTLTLAVAVVLGSANAAPAQIGVYNRPQINSRPTVSPYLSIFRGNPAINYYGSVRPQIEMNREINQLQQGFQQGQPNLALPLDQQQQQGPLSSTTGHPTSFMNYSHYYGNRSGSGGGVAGGGGGPTGSPNLNLAPYQPFTPTQVSQ